MDFRSLLQSMTTLSEAEGKVHKGTYGTSHGKEDVRDQYGHKVGKLDKEAGSKKDAPKKGRGRPKKGADDSGEVKTYDTKTLGDVFGGGKKPKKEVGKVSKKHSLKEYMESVEATKAEQLDEGVMDWAKEKYHDYQTGRQWRKFGQAQQKGDTAGMQAAQDAANVHRDQLQATRLKRTGSTLAKNSNFGQDQDRANIAALQKKGLVPQNYGRIEEEGMGEAEQVTIAPAQQNTQVIKQGTKTLGTVTNPQLAATIKSAIGKGEMSLAGDDLEESGLQAYLGNKKYGKEGMDALRKAGRDGASKEKMANIRAKYDKMDEEALDQPATMEGAPEVIRDREEVVEKAPPGAKAERMVKHIKAGYAKNGKLTDVEKRKAYGATWKAHNKGKVEESMGNNQEVLTEGQKEQMIRFFDELENGPKGYNINAAVELKDRGLASRIIDKTLQHGDFKRMAGTYKGQLKDAALEHFGFTDFEESLEEADINPRDSSSLRPQHALAEPTSSFSKPGSPMAVPRGTATKLNRPVEEPTPWGTDPIAAATDRAFNFVSSLGKGTKFTKEGKEDMKDIQVESWEKQLNGLLTEGITVSSSQGQQGSPDSVSITATDNDAQTLMGVLRNAGIGGFGADTKPEIGYGVAQGGEEEPTGTGTEPEAAPEVVGDGDDMLALIKKLTGLGDEAEVVAVGGDEEGQDYEDEEGEEPQTLEPADSGEDDGKEELTGSEDDSEEKTDEGNDFTEKLKDTPKGGTFEIGGKTYTDTSNLEEDDMEEGAGAMHLAKEKAEKEGKSSFTLGDKTFPVKEGDEETCNECGMYESKCGCETEQVEENFSNDAGGDAMADTELAKLKALLSMGNDLHKMKADQTVGNPTRVSVRESLNEWKKLSGIK